MKDQIMKTAYLSVLVVIAGDIDRITEDFLKKNAYNFGRFK